jgi:ribosome biogenesis GTPase
MTDHDKHTIKKNQNAHRYRQDMQKSERRKKLQLTNKKLGRQQQSKRTRQKNWLPDHSDDWDDLDYEREERVMPRNERERRRTVEKVAFQATEPEADDEAAQTGNVAGQKGVITEVSSGLCQVDLGDAVLPCRIPGRLKAAEQTFTNVVAVGDEVLVSEDGAGSGMVEAVLPRRSVLARPDVFHSHLRQVIVANADQLLIVSSWREPAIWLELIDRYLITAERSHLPAAICINKMDLAEDEAEYRQALQPYRELGYRVILTSALTGAGIAGLRAVLQNRTTVLAGLSGVGKSSLLTAVQPSLQLRVGEVSERRHEGRHTTTQTTLLKLADGSTVIDTPGIREFGLSGLRQPELVDFFPEMAALAPDCRFHNCSHLNEPDCAVQAALDNGTIAASRYHSYRQIFETLPG